MHKMIIKDVKDLKQSKEQINELERKIEELDEVKLLKKKRQQQLELNNKIKELSTYDLELISDIIIKLMSKYEGILFECKERYFKFDDYDYIIEPKINFIDFYSIYSNYKLKKINNSDNWIYNINEENPLIYLPPSFFISNSVLDKKSNDKYNSYIQYFLDFLYEKRSESLLYMIKSEDLENILKEFLLITKDLQQKRKEEIKRKIDEKLCYKKRFEFEKTCMIDRKLIYNSLSYIINNYEDNILAKQEYEKTWSRSNEWSELYGYHNLIIETENNKLCFKTLVDSEGCYPDEEYCGVYVDMNKDTKICFFDLKKTIIPIIKSCMYVEKFMNAIENLYNQNANIPLFEIEEILVIISNDRKGKNKVLKKDI